LRTIVLILLCVFVPYISHAASQASPEWFDRVAARALDFIPVHNACMEFLDGIRADGRLILTADIDGALGTKRLEAATEYGPLSAWPVHGNLSAFVGYAMTNATVGMLVTGSILELSTETRYNDLLSTSMDTNTVTFRHGDVFFGGYLRVGTDVSLSAGIRSRQLPRTTTATNGERVFRIDSGGVQIESHDSFFLYGDVCGFRVNAQFSGDGLDLATVLYRIALGGSLGELLPTLGKSSLSDSLDVAIFWRTIPVPQRLRTAVGTGLRLWDAAEFSPGFSWVRGDIDWNLYTGDIWRVNVTGGVSYTDAWMWQRLPGRRSACRPDTASSRANCSSSSATPAITSTSCHASRSKMSKPSNSGLR